MEVPELAKKLKLITKNRRQIFYRGIITNGKLKECKLIRQVSECPQIVEICIDNKYQFIHLDYLKEMQPSKKELEDYRQLDVIL